MGQAGNIGSDADNGCRFEGYRSLGADSISKSRSTDCGEGVVFIRSWRGLIIEC